MQEVQIGAPLEEFPGRSFNEMQRRIKQLEAQRLPRVRGRKGGGGGDSHIPEFIAVIATAIDAGGNPSSGTPGQGTGTIYRIRQSLSSDLAAYEAVTDFSEVLPVPENTHAEPAILNPHPYQARPGIYPVEFVGTMVMYAAGDPDPEDTDPYAVFSITDHDLLSFAEGTATPFLLGKSGSTIRWVDVEEYGGIPGPEGPEGPAGPTYSEGYCVEIDTTTIHHDAITSAAGTQAVGIDTAEQQVWVHFAGATSRTDAKWQTIDLYDAAHPCAAIFNFAGSWEWANFQSYSATAFQLFVNDNDDFDLKTITGYDVAKKQVFYHEAGTWKALDIPTSGTKLLGSVSGTLQFLDVADFTCPE